MMSPSSLFFFFLAFSFLGFFSFPKIFCAIFAWKGQLLETCFASSSTNNTNSNEWQTVCTNGVVLIVLHSHGNTDTDPFCLHVIYRIIQSSFHGILSRNTCVRTRSTCSSAASWNASTSASFAGIFLPSHEPSAVQLLCDTPHSNSAWSPNTFHWLMLAIAPKVKPILYLYHWFMNRTLTQWKLIWIQINARTTSSHNTPSVQLILDSFQYNNLHALSTHCWQHLLALDCC